MNKKYGFFLNRIILAILAIIIILILFTIIQPRLFLFSRAKGKIVFVYEKSGAYSHIIVTNSLGFPFTSLSPKDAFDSNPQLSPDGSKIAFICQQNGHGICIMNSDGTDRRIITLTKRFPYGPNWSNDGAQIIFSDTEIFIYDFYENKLIQLTNDGYEKSDPIMSPDGKMLAYVSIENGDWYIKIINISERHIQYVTSDHAFAISPIWSNDGKYLFFNSDLSGNDEIYRIELNNSELLNLTNDPLSSDVICDISPNGQYILYEKRKNTDPANEIDIYLMKIDGTNTKQLTNAKGLDSYPDWSPDGLFITFISGRNLGWSIYIMTIEGNYQTKISFGDSVADPSWEK